MRDASPRTSLSARIPGQPRSRRADGCGVPVPPGAQRPSRGPARPRARLFRGPDAWIGMFFVPARHPLGRLGSPRKNQVQQRPVEMLCQAVPSDRASILPEFIAPSPHYPIREPAEACVRPVGPSALISPQRLRWVYILSTWVVDIQNKGISSGAALLVKKNPQHYGSVMKICNMAIRILDATLWWRSCPEFARTLLHFHFCQPW
jgi:hypothetical protein